MCVALGRCLHQVAKSNPAPKGSIPKHLTRAAPDKLVLICQTKRMVNILGKWASLSVAFWAAESLLPGITVTGEASTYLLIAFIFGIVNVTAGNLYRLLTFPITILTLGLWSFVVNAFMLLATDSFVDALFVDGFWWALAGALVISFVSSVVNSVLSSVTK